MEMRLPDWLIRPPKRLAEIKQTPWPQQATLLCGVFLLFSVFGFFNDLIHGGTGPYVVTLTFAFLGGLTSAVASFAGTRLPPVYYVAPLIVLQVFSNRLYGALERFLVAVFNLRPVRQEDGISFAAVWIIFVVIASYICFVRYMRYMSRVSFRLRNELELAHAIQKTLVPVLSRRIPRLKSMASPNPAKKLAATW